MAEYFINKIYEGHSTNNKTSELQSYLRQYKNMLIESDEALETLKEKICDKVAELNEKYKRTKQFSVYMHKSDSSDTFMISIYPDGRSDMVGASVCGNIVKSHYNGKEK